MRLALIALNQFFAMDSLRFCFRVGVLTALVISAGAGSPPSNTLPLALTPSPSIVISSTSSSPTLSSDIRNGTSLSAKEGAPEVFRKVPSTYLPDKFQAESPDEIDVFQIDPSMFTFAKDGFQFVSQDPDVKEIVTKLDKWSQNPRTRRVKTKIGELQWHMASHMRRFLRKVLPPHIKAYDVTFRVLPNKDGESVHQNEKAELHTDFNKHDFRVWVPRRRLDGGLIVSPSTAPPFQLFGGSVDMGDAWVFHSGVYHGPAPWKEPADRGFFGTVSFCTSGEGSCWKEEEEEDALPPPTLLLS
mmetsp:Transcript_1536/g.2260  ORF Transcript_1536/g.2260 Transcript_1536/m.2260 type:complete len:301 (-) Transcript_1536:380-1282(-)